MAKFEPFRADGILIIDPLTFTVLIGYEVRLNVDKEVLVTETLTGLKAIPTSEIPSETIPICCEANGTPAPDRKDTAVAERDVPTIGGKPVLAADKRFVWKV
jgi:hypothetical protein